jgi:DNA-cytosine methyltransferase
MRGATLFSGGGGAEALLKDCIDFVHAVEYDAQIAAVYRQNHGDHVQVADVCDVDYSLWGRLDYLHASPVCKNASQAKTGGEESDTDMQTALAVVRCLEATQPRVFTLENVGGYQKFQAYRRICQALDHMGYMWHAEVLNAADFGVPQTRRRLILRAVRDSLLPGWPAPLPWVGWYVAIEDLIPTLPESKFADWQLARLPDGLHSSTLIHSTDMRSMPTRDGSDPAFTVLAHSFAGSHYPGGDPRAFIVSNAATEFGDGLRYGNEPSHAITPQANGRTRAWLVDGTTNDSGRTLTIREEGQPAHTIKAAVHKTIPRAWLSAGRVVKMTPRALARFQSLPDSFWLPDKASLACTVIGNAVPSLLMREIVRPLL